MGASMTSSTFSALGSFTSLSTAISPDARNVVRRKMTVTMRKSMYAVRLRFAFGERRPRPTTLLNTYASGSLRRRRLPGWWMACACGSCFFLFGGLAADMGGSLSGPGRRWGGPFVEVRSAHRERHVEDGDLLGLAAE